MQLIGWKRLSGRSSPKTSAEGWCHAYSRPLTLFLRYNHELFTIQKLGHLLFWCLGRKSGNQRIPEGKQV